MKRHIFYIVLCLCSAMAMAQETYESAQLATEDLNGTARYIGMGGAMEALGADISTMGTNPAGIGMFRRSWIGISGGATIQSGQGNNNAMAGMSTSNGKSNADMNQAGFIYSNKFSYNSHFNLGFNYHKSRNFNQIISAANSLDENSSSSKLSWMRRANYNDYTPSAAYPRPINSAGITLLDYYNLRAVNDPIFDKFSDKEIYYRPANAYNALRDNTGYISEFDFNFSANFNDRVYIGLTFGLKDVNYKSEYNYKETLLDGAYGYPAGNYSFYENRKISGTGFDLKFGAIIRPSEYSPFRFGLYMHTPTWYDLTCESTLITSAHAEVNGNIFDGPMRKYNPSDVSNSFRYDYRIVTPWKFGASVGHTFGKMVAIGATYEYADYSTIKNRIKTGRVVSTYYDGWGPYSSSYNTYSDDTQMNNHTDKTLKGVSLVKIGVEVKPSQLLALRVGYNYQSAIYKEDGKKSTTINAVRSIGYDYSTQDYVNWKDTHRITFGMGFTFDKNWALDLSYQYALQNGDYHPFSSMTLNSGDVEDRECYDNPTTVKNKRHMINATLGYRF